MKQSTLQPSLFAEAVPTPHNPYVVCIGLDNVPRQEPVDILGKRRFTENGEWWVKVRFQHNGTMQFLDLARIVNCPDLRNVKESW